ncbi:MAG: amidase [Magnetovibrio sp.]|nr:amidase [Magnetovibrio sp.]
MLNDLTEISACALLSAYQAKNTSPVEVIRAVFKKVSTHDRSLNAFRLVDESMALSEARKSESRWHKGEPLGILDGVPVSVKDVFSTKHWSTRWGSLLTTNKSEFNEDAPAVARLREEGAVLIGKTNTSEFHWKTVTDSPLTGITRNPWNLDLTPGGSCGGASVAVASGMGPIAIGTDGGGSIRVPAAFTGVFGFKPTFGRVPQFPVGAFGTMAHVGPITRSVEDAALVLTALSKPDIRDWYALPYLNVDYRENLGPDLKGKKIAFSPDLGFVQVGKSVAKVVKNGMKLFSELGAHVETVDPGFSDTRDTFEKLGFSGIYQTLKHFTPEEKKRMDQGLVTVVELGKKVTLTEYLEANRNRESLGQLMGKFHETFDLLITPTVPIPPFLAGQDVPEPKNQERWTEWAPFSYPFNLTRQPAASVPCGFDADGHPVGLQIVGPLFSDQLVLNASRAFELARPFVFPDLGALKDL